MTPPAATQTPAVATIVDSDEPPGFVVPSATLMEGNGTKAPATVTFLAGQVRKAVAITLRGDTVIEPDETFGLALSVPVGAAIADGAGVVTIVDDDTVPVVRVQSVSTVEGHPGAGWRRSRCGWIGRSARWGR